MIKINQKVNDFELDGYFPKEDKIKKIKRGPAVMISKDIGAIIVNTGINKRSEVIEAGTGSGMLAAYLSRVVKRVYGYEKRKDFYELAKKNFKFLKIRNIKLKNEDVKKAKEKVDLIVLDLANPWEYRLEKNLKDKGFLVCYLPNITQVMELVKNNKLKFIKMIEIIEREWIIDEKRARPKNVILGHTGFLVFLRKI